MLPNPCEVKPNPYLTDTYKHDFIEWWNIVCKRKKHQEVVLGVLFAEAAEAAYCAGTYGPPPKGEDDGSRNSGKAEETNRAEEAPTIASYAKTEPKEDNT